VQIKVLAAPAIKVKRSGRERGQLFRATSLSVEANKDSYLTLPTMELYSFGT